LLESLYYLRHYEKFKKTLEELENVTKQLWFPVDDNLEGLAFLYIYNNKFNLHFIEGSFKEGLPMVEKVLENLKKYQDRIDEHHIMVFYYKIASLYFGAGESKKCIFFLEKIIENKSLEMREDLLCFARILNLVAHYEAGLDYNLETLIKSTFKFLIKMEDLYEVQKEFIKFLRGLGDISPNEVRGEFIKLHEKLKQYEDDPYQSRAFLYLDIISWLESKIDNKPIGLVIKDKFESSLLKK
jgi:tetratricopeptide (TPR) repeat protein